MNKAKRLTKRQFAVLEDLFAGDSDETAVLKKHNVSRTLYNQWLADPVFTGQFDVLIAGAYRRSAFAMARNASKAAKNLFDLTESDKGETARKACLDIINMRPSARIPDPPAVPADKEASPPESPKLSTETAGKLLAVLAEEKPDSVS